MFECRGANVSQTSDDKIKMTKRSALADAGKRTPHFKLKSVVEDVPMITVPTNGRCSFGNGSNKKTVIV